MRLFCVWCRKWFSGEGVCEGLPAGGLDAFGAARYVPCCPHAKDGQPPAGRGGARHGHALP